MTLSIVRLFLTALLANTTTRASASAFSTSVLEQQYRIKTLSRPKTVLLRGGGFGRGGGGNVALTSPTALTAATMGDSASAKNKKVRIPALDSMRFFLIMNIVLGHFIMFAQPSSTVLKFFSQHNVLVGAFFALSGYVTVRNLFLVVSAFAIVLPVAIPVDAVSLALDHIECLTIPIVLIPMTYASTLH
jgi:hypothetical protein